MAHATKYAIGSRGWDLWEGPAPLLQTERQQALSRPGVDGIQHQRLGKGSEGFDVVVTGFYASLVVARLFVFDVLNEDLSLDPQIVVWENVSWFAAYNHKYQIADIQQLDLRSVRRAIGPGFDYPAGARAVMRYRLYPEAL